MSLIDRESKEEKGKEVKRQKSGFHFSCDEQRIRYTCNEVLFASRREWLGEKRASDGKK